MLEEQSEASSSTSTSVRRRGGAQRSAPPAQPPKLQSMPIGKSRSLEDESDADDGADLWDDSVDGGLRPTDKAPAKASCMDALFLYAQLGCCCAVVLGMLAGLLIPLMTQKLDKSLLSAVKLGDIESVSHILDQTSKKIYVDAPGTNDKTALHWAVIKGHQAVAAMLLERRANVELGGSHGVAALHYAAREGNDELLHQLIDAGASVNSTDANGWTPLHWAATYGHVRVSQSLIAARADVFAEASDQHHKTALSLSQSNGYAPLTRIIDEAMQEAESRLPVKGKGSSAWSLR